MGVEETKRLAVELIDWYQEGNIDPDDAVPALLIVGTKLAVGYRIADNELLNYLLDLIRATFTDELQRKQDVTGKRN